MVGDTVPEVIDKPFDLTQDMGDTISYIKKTHPKFKHIFGKKNLFSNLHIWIFYILYFNFLAIGHSYGAN